MKLVNKYFIYYINKSLDNNKKISEDFLLKKINNIYVFYLYIMFNKKKENNQKFIELYFNYFKFNEFDSDFCSFSLIKNQNIFNISLTHQQRFIIYKNAAIYNRMNFNIFENFLLEKELNIPKHLFFELYTYFEKKYKIYYEKNLYEKIIIKFFSLYLLSYDLSVSDAAIFIDKIKSFSFQNKYMLRTIKFKKIMKNKEIFSYLLENIKDLRDNFLENNCIYNYQLDYYDVLDFIDIEIIERKFNIFYLNDNKYERFPVNEKLLINKKHNK